MENNSIITGVIPGSGSTFHKTYEESFLYYIERSYREKLFSNPKQTGLFLDPVNNNIVCLDLIELSNRSSKLRRLEIISIMDSNNMLLFELIDAEILHNHLVHDAYERQKYIEINSRGL